MNSDLQKISKLLSLVLRHQPERLGLELDVNGWISVNALVEASGISKDVIAEVIATSDKQRFSFSPDGSLIRANQGHSIQGVNLELLPLLPPQKLFHGTVEKFLEAIAKDGLCKMSRLHVHLSECVETAHAVGARRGKPVILEVNAGLMHKEGYTFFKSLNGVWLTDRVPPEFIQSPW